MDPRLLFVVWRESFDESITIKIDQILIINTNSPYKWAADNWLLGSFFFVNWLLGSKSSFCSSHSRILNFILFMQVLCQTKTLM